MPDRVRRNGGRPLVVVIESSDNIAHSALQALSVMTRTSVGGWGFDTSLWPPDVRPVLEGIGTKDHITRVDSFGFPHVFAKVDCGAYDVLFGVSSRRERNVSGDRSGNLATNVLLEVLSTTDHLDPLRPLYGEVLAEDLNRVWRSQLAAVFMHQHAQDWDLTFRSRTDHLDYMMAGTSLVALIRGEQSSKQATDLIVNGSKHRSTAHSEGVLKYSTGQTHPLIAVHPETKRMTYDEDVVRAFRRSVELLRQGSSWQEVAEAVGACIPARKLQQLPDQPDERRLNSRKTLNDVRVERGLLPLPYRLNPDGTANVDYQPETLNSLNDPGNRLRELLVRGPTVPPRLRALAGAYLDIDLQGLSPGDASLEFYATGVYRRLCKDQDLSNSSVQRYRWAEVDLGPTADGRYVLERSDIDFLRNHRTGKGGSGSHGTNPLIGVFKVESETSLFTRNGWRDSTTGNFVVRGSVLKGTRGLRIWHEPFGATPHADSCSVVGWLPQTAIGTALAEMLIDACSTNADAASFRFDITPSDVDPGAAPRQRLHSLLSRHRTVISELDDSSLSERSRSAFKAKLASLDALLDQAEADVAAAEDVTTSSVPTHSDTYRLTDLASLAAICQVTGALPPTVAAKASRIARALLPDARLAIDTSSGEIHIEATLTIRNSAGTLTLPVRRALTNQASDPWVAGVAGMWWSQRRPLADLMAERGLATPVTQATRWQQPIARRLMIEAAANGRPLRGPNLARLLVRCPDAEMISAIRDAITFGTSDALLHAFLFEGPDERSRQPWVGLGR